MKRITALIVFSMALAWPFAAAAGSRGSVEGEAKRSYGSIDVVMYQTSW